MCTPALKPFYFTGKAILMDFLCSDIPSERAHVHVCECAVVNLDGGFEVESPTSTWGITSGGGGWLDSGPSDLNVRTSRLQENATAHNFLCGFWGKNSGLHACE